VKLAYLVSAALLVAVATPAVAEISDGKVKIGILNDQSGVYADFGGKWSFEAAKMAVEDFGGKVQRAPIEVISADHQNKPDIASNIARQWHDTEQVDAIMELTTSWRLFGEVPNSEVMNCHSGNPALRRPSIHLERSSGRHV
jgi:branched-chain amino acid transport system substrate-binding protein